MTLEAVLASLHLVAILTLVVFMSSQAALCRIEWLNAAVVERLVRLDVIYNVTALVLLLTGLARVVWGIKGMSWYVSQPLFHVKVTLFVVMVLLSIWPTLTFRRWCSQLRAAAGPRGGAGAPAGHGAVAHPARGCRHCPVLGAWLVGRPRSG